MREFYYLPPEQDDQRAFVMQFLGAASGLLVVAFLWWRASSFELRAVLIGAGLAILWMLGKAAWQLEKKARRSQLAKVGFDENQLIVVDWHGAESQISWNEVTACDVKGGRLSVEWNGGKLLVGARELENGMEFIQHVARRVHGDKSTFIPLSAIDGTQEKR